MNDVLHPPRAHGGPAGTGTLRTVPEDFIVKEWLGFDADGEGDHWLLTVRKREANTHWVAKQLARLGNFSSRDVGFAGLKDRGAVAEQAFTVPVRTAMADWAGVVGEGFEVVAAARHRRKLKRGALRGNAFAIVIRDWRGDTDVLNARLQALAQQGAPNYFGPQRFGRDGSNLRTAQRWFAEGIAPDDRVQRSFALSAARSAIFNAVLAARVTRGTWNQLVPGEIVNLNGSGSVFEAPVIDEILQQRCQLLDIHPTGPLWGLSSTPRGGELAALEQDIADRCAVLSHGLIEIRVEAERRALRMAIGDLRWTVDGDAVRLEFRLRRGSFATAVLHEIIDTDFAHDVPEGAD